VKPLLPTLSARPRVGALLAGCLAAVLTAGPAAGAGLSIAWDDCHTPLGMGQFTKSFGCASEGLDFPLFASFSLPATMDSVYSMELVIDVDVAIPEGNPLPAWWLMAPGCRNNGWAADGSGSLSSCPDAWGGLGTGSFQGWLPGTPGSSTRHARLLVAVGVLPEDAVTLLGNASYTACRILLRTVNTLSCGDGCTTPACLVFNSLLVRRRHTPEDVEIVLSGGESGGSDRVVWQGGAGADCAAVPTRRTTWAAVKALYR
jgi:hypothetical protein